MTFNNIIWTAVGADLSCSPPIMEFNKIFRIAGNPAKADKSAPTAVQMMLLMCIIGPHWISRYSDEKVKKHNCAPT
jgi:hypothetical protein